ncbi:MAG: hypothetical protein KBA02_04250 [Paludibacteraceae bacterium]|nr:hypothetical protein [Paludibacteraceae bacterium]
MAILAVVFATSCEKMSLENEVNINQKDLDSLPIRQFSDFDSLYNEVENTIKFSHEELVAYENSIGVESFGKLAENIYYPIVDNDTNMSYEDLLQVVQENSEFLQIKEIDGEEYFETKYCNSPFRYIMNANCMFKVDSTLFKVFENGHVTCNVSYLNELINMTEDDFLNLDEENGVFTIHNRVDNLKTNYGQKYIAIATNSNGKERVKVELCYIQGERRMVNNQVVVWGSFAVKTKGYRKFAGVFWNVKRTTENNLWATIHVYNSDQTGSAIRTVFDYKNESLLYRVKVTLPVYENDPNIYICDGYGYGKIPAITCTLNL